MKLKTVLLAGLDSVTLLTIGADSALAGGYFLAGNPGGLRAASSYLLAPTPANQAWERNNALGQLHGTKQAGTDHVNVIPGQQRSVVVGDER